MSDHRYPKLNEAVVDRLTCDQALIFLDMSESRSRKRPDRRLVPTILSEVKQKKWQTDPYGIKTEEKANKIKVDEHYK